MKYVVDNATEYEIMMFSIIMQLFRGLSAAKESSVPQPSESGRKVKPQPAAHVIASRTAAMRTRAE